METNKTSKSKCFIFDLDGTLAQRTGRSPYDWTKVSEDIPHTPIQSIYESIYRYESYEIIILTGRDESCRADTEAWLKKWGFFYTTLLMRPAGSKELDTSVKIVLYREHIEPFYEVIAVFEDRERVVNMWRKHLGLTCLQVAEGKF